MVAVVVGVGVVVVVGVGVWVVVGVWVAVAVGVAVGVVVVVGVWVAVAVAVVVAVNINTEVMNHYFDIARAWNGTSEKLGRSRSYHPTVSVHDEPQRQLKAGTQDAIVLEAMRRLKRGTGSTVHKDLSGAMLIGSVRRSLTNLADHGMLRRNVAVEGPHKHPEVEYVFP